MIESLASSEALTDKRSDVGGLAGKNTKPPNGGRPKESATPEADSEENETWISKEEAAKILGVKVRQIQNRAAEGYIRRGFLPRRPNESHPRACYSKTDVLALKSGNPNQYAVEVEPVRNSLFETIEPSAAKPEPSRISETTRMQFALAASPLAAPWMEKPRTEPRAWLTLQEAEQHSGLPEATLLALCKAGYVRAIDLQGQEVGIRTLHRLYRISRASLDDWGKNL